VELLHYMTNRVPIENQYHRQIDALFRTETHKKGTILLQPDNRSQKLIFIESGLLRMFYPLGDKLVTFLFLGETAMMLPLESIFYNKPDPYGWEVVQDCTLRTTQYTDFFRLVETVPGVERFLLYETFRVLKEMADKLYGIQLQSAEERYKTLLQTHPDILQLAPLGHIASYLGITQQTLSVIRAKKN
jgi:CRP-like cAMP-binding protein